MKLRSDTATSGIESSAARALWRATGTKDEDFGKPIIAIANSFTQFVPGHVHLKDLGDLVAKEVYAAGGIAKEFNTIAVDDGIAMHHDGMLYSLPSRDLIADSVEYMVNAHCADALVCISNCDKITPGMMMAAARLNIPTIFVTGGPMESGKVFVDGEEHRIDVIDTLTVAGNPQSTEQQILDVERSACPTCGSCAIMGTANSMNCLIESLGMCLPGNGTLLATHTDREQLFRKSGRRIVEMATAFYGDGDTSVLPRSIVTRESLENAMRVSMAMCGSSNTILHILAIAREAFADFDMDDIAMTADDTPYLCKITPAAPQVFIEDMHRAGGVYGILGALVRAGKIHRQVPTVHCKTMGEAISKWDIAGSVDEEAISMFLAGPGGKFDLTAFGQSERFSSVDKDRQTGVIRDVDHAFDETGGMAVLKGNLAEQGCIIKAGAVHPDCFEFEGSALCFDSKDTAIDAINDGTVQAGHVVVIRYEGPRGGPGMQEMLTPTSMLKGRGLDKVCGLITDGRFSGATSGISVGHISPEAASGGLIGLLEDGDRIRVDIRKRSIEAVLTDEEIARRRTAMNNRGKTSWQPARNRTVSTALRIYGLMATSASEGGVRDTERLDKLEAQRSEEAAG